MDNNHQQHDKEAEAAILQNVEEYGCHLALVEADNYLPAFVYSIGLFKNYQHPEIICFGLKTDVMGHLINHFKDMVKLGHSFEPSILYEGFLKDYPVQFVKVDQAYYADYLGYAGWFYDSTFEFPVLQLVWPDKEGRFPWESEFNPNFKFRQLLLDRNIDFRFYEERNLGVYTTKQAFEGEAILYAYHNSDGAWQFHTSLTPDIKDAKVVALEQIVKLDPSINDIYHLQYGWRAWRENQKADWQYEIDNKEDT
ncbi:MAG: DUF4262 domain-containing protein [Mucilaginibacter sp.]